MLVKIILSVVEGGGGGGGGGAVTLTELNMLERKYLFFEYGRCKSSITNCLSKRSRQTE